MSNRGRFQGTDYRMIRSCISCGGEVEVFGDVCWRCTSKVRQAEGTKAPIHRRITMRGWLVVIAGTVFLALVGLLAMARLAH